MRYAREFVVSAVVGGLLVLLPIYLAVLVLLKGMQSVANLLRPIAALVPDWVPGENIWSLAVVLIALLCGWRRGAYAGGTSGSRADGGDVLWTTSRLRGVSQPDTAARGRER